MSEKKVMIECINAGFGYDNKAIVENLNFVVNEGDYVCIVGENGSGKSTLIKSILGLLKPIYGKVKIDCNSKNGSIGYLPQQTQSQKDFPATVYEVVLSGFLSVCKNRPFYTPIERSIALKNMDKLNILKLKKKCYRELSGGQQQRALLARALCAADKILVLDEPVTGLDQIATSELYENLRYLNQEEKMTIVMVSHDIQNALKQSNKVLYIGQSCFYGTVQDFLKSEDGRNFAGGEKICK
nr:ATP-binding cassette domain-containing protein [Sedimentibacter sp.]